MNLKQIEHLDYKAQQWLFAAMARMVMADHKVAAKEVQQFKAAMIKLVGSADERAIKERLTHADFQSPLRPLHNLRPAQAWVVFREIAQIAASDSELHTDEEAFLREVIECLGVDSKQADALVTWTRKLAQVKAEEAAFVLRLPEIFPENDLKSPA